MVVQRKNEAKKVFRKVKTSSLKVGLALTNQKRVQAEILTRTKAEARTKKEGARKVLILKSGLSASATPSEEEYGHA